MPAKKLFLLDAYALIFRAYYALIRNPRITSKGKNTNAQFGFTNTLIELINKEKPTHMAVCFDVGGSVIRETDYADYKANRQETPEDLLAAVPDIKKIIEGFNIPVIGIEGYEADDVIGTLAWEAHDAGYEVYMVTPDKDYGQLVRDGIYIYKPAYQGGKAEILGPKEVCEKWDIENVHQVIDILGLMGDAVDNIPGIKGVGEKTAAKLLKEYHSLENVLANANNIKGSLGEKIKAGKDDAILSKKLATIITKVPVSFHEENFSLKDWNKDALKEIFTTLEFKTLGSRILGEEITIQNNDNTTPNVQKDLFGNIITPNAENKSSTKKTTNTLQEIDEETILNTSLKNIQNTDHQYYLIQTEHEIDEMIEKLLPFTEICIDTETTGIDANNASLVGISFSCKAHEAYYIPCSENKEATQKILQQLNKLFSNTTITWIGQNIKYDTMLAHYVAEPEGKRSMDLLSATFLNYQPIPIEDLIGKKGKSQGNMRDVAIEKIKDYAAEDADITFQLKQAIHPLLNEKNVANVFYEVDNPLVKVLADMEFEGVKVDEAFLVNYSKELEKDAKQAEDNVYKLAGVKFNLASPKQLGEVLFDKLQLDSSAKKTKTGQYQTGEEVLQSLAAKGHEIADNILVFRELTKLKSTYADALPLMINRKSNKVHTSYAQTVVVTGRLSSSNPNLQNIPIRTNRGKEIRKAFIPSNQQHVLISADYSQIELRIVAAISGDKNMCDAFLQGKDIHTATAAKVYNVDEASVTKEMRYKAKSVNFGIIYGQGAFGLAENLGISRTEAKEIIDNYKREFPGIQKYMDDTINFARENGFVQTIMGRKRWLKDINSSNFTVRGFAERNAINAPIQGSAADVIKIAMINIFNEFEKQQFQSKMLLQVHDELVFDVYKPELEILKPIIRDKMEHAVKLSVPLEVEMNAAKNWLEAH